MKCTELNFCQNLWTPPKKLVVLAQVSRRCTQARRICGQFDKLHEISMGRVFPHGGFNCSVSVARDWSMVQREGRSGKIFCSSARASSHALAFLCLSREVWTLEWKVWDNKVVLPSLCWWSSWHLCAELVAQVHQVAFCWKTEGNCILLQWEVQIPGGHRCNRWHSYHVDQAPWRLFPGGLLQYKKEDLHNVAAGEYWVVLHKLVHSSSLSVASLCQRDKKKIYGPHPPLNWYYWVLSLNLPWISIRSCAPPSQLFECCQCSPCISFVSAHCFEDLTITSIDVGQPGKANDAMVFKMSNLWVPSGGHVDHIVSNPDFHLLGDGAYPSKSYVLKPFHDAGDLTRSQRKYNFVHSSIRSMVERGIGRLNGRFRCLHFLDVHMPDKGKK